MTDSVKITLVALSLAPLACEDPEVRSAAPPPPGGALSVDEPGDAEDLQEQERLQAQQQRARMRHVSGEALQDAAATAIVRDKEGREIGRAALSETDDGVMVEFWGFELLPGPHAIHVHEVGSCSDPAFASAGDHLDPQDQHHGLSHPEGAHLGDMPNVVVGPEGMVHYRYELEGARLEGSDPESLLSHDGSALIVHYGVDDQRTAPSGQAGDRYACGVIRAS